MPPPDHDPGPDHRTRLANERTYLAWWRTGLTAFAAGVGAGKVVPELSPGATDAYTAIGVGFSLLGAACCGYAALRYRAVDRALERGEFAPPHRWAIAALAGIGALVGLGFVVLLLAG